MRRPVLVALCLLGASGFVLQAQFVDFGAQLTLAKPTMDLEGGTWIRGRSALGFGLRLPCYFDRNQALVPRLDVLNIKAGPVAILNGATSDRNYTALAKVRLVSLGVDYDYYLSGRPEDGPYLGCGLGLSQADFQNAQLLPGGYGPPLPDGAWPVDQTKKAVQYALQAGWKLDEHLAVEARYTQSDFKSVGTPGTLVKAPVFSFSIVVEF